MIDYQEPDLAGMPLALLPSPDEDKGHSPSAIPCQGRAGLSGRRSLPESTRASVGTAVRDYGAGIQARPQADTDFCDGRQSSVTGGPLCPGPARDRHAAAPLQDRFSVSR